MFKKNRRGFSLVETIIAVSLAIILALSAFIGGGKLMHSARETRVGSDMDSFTTATQQLFSEKAEIANNPDDCTLASLSEYLPSELQVTDTDPTAIVSDTVKTDPWGTPYTAEISYIGPGDVTVTYTSAGADTEFGSEDDYTRMIELLNGEVSVLSFGAAGDDEMYGMVSVSMENAVYSAASLSVNGNTVGTGFTKKYNPGETVNLAAENTSNNFLYWRINIGNTSSIYSTNEDISYIVPANGARLTAVYKDPTLGHYVRFNAYHSKRIIVEGYVSESSTVKVPSASDSFVSGYIFNGWNVNGLFNSSIVADMILTPDIITSDSIMTGSYTPTNIAYHINVPADKGAASPTSAVYNQAVTVTAVETYDGKVFSYWKNEDTGALVSYSRAYTFYCGNYDVNLIPIFEDVAREEVPAISTTSQIFPDAPNKIQFLSLRNNVAGYTYVGAGILMLPESTYNTLINPEESFNLNTSGVICGAATRPAAGFTIRKSNVAIGDTWYGRAYYSFRAPGSDETTTIYSNITHTTYFE